MEKEIKIPTVRVKHYARRKLVCNWEIADALNISEASITRLFRRAELPESKATEIYAAIDEISRLKGSNDDSEE